MKIFLFLLMPCFVFLSACLPDERVNRNYPKVTTHAPLNITTLGVDLLGEVEYSNPEKILARGFAFIDDLGEIRGSLSPDSVVDKLFYVRIRTGLTSNKVYHVRAFVKTAGNIVYGDVKTFRSLGSEGPLITSVSPDYVGIGDTITVTGKNFNSGFTLRYADLYQPFDILEVKENKITMVLAPFSFAFNPIDIPEGFISIAVGEKTSTSQRRLKLNLYRIFPKITSISPLSAKACDTMTLVGRNLKFPGGNISVIDGERLLTVLKESRDTIICVLKRVPNELYFKVVNHRDNRDEFNASSYPIDIIELRPEVISVSPTVYKANDVITIKVKNFPFCDNTLVAMVSGTTVVLPILSKTSDEIKVQLPNYCLGVFSINLVLPSGVTVQENYGTPTLSPDSTCP